MTSVSSLFMIELKPDIRMATTWMLEQPRRIVRPGHDDGYGWHALLAAAFSDLAPKPFRLIERPGREPQLLAYTPVEPEELIDQARLHADPAVYRALGIGKIAHKPLPTTFATGQRLGFEVRVRPTVRQDCRDPETGSVDRRRSRERDAFLAAADAEILPRGERPEIDREKVYRDWLIARFGNAAKLEPDTFALARLSRTMLLRPRHDNGREVVPVGLLKRGTKAEQGGSPDATFHGELTITDPARFHALLARGVGRHLSFGFGMLLLRPPRRR